VQLSATARTGRKTTYNDSSGKGENPMASSSTADRVKEQVNDKISETASKAREKTSDVTSRLQEAGSQAAQMAQDSLSQLRDSASEYYEQGRQRLQTMGKRVQGQIVEAPMKSVLIAAGLGFVIGFLVMRR
jgi:ElaB/YqjD/DUF883 family membrane-anchored ribosome-binding protein